MPRGGMVPVIKGHNHRIKPKIRNTANKANRYTPMPVKSDLVTHAYAVNARKTPAVTVRASNTESVVYIMVIKLVAAAWHTVKIARNMKFRGNCLRISEQQHDTPRSMAAPTSDKPMNIIECLSTHSLPRTMCM
mmetsp:Transcript_52578/g.104331  ORF Transcript_52578/g.104331 Transcript_52578/m.104331 type:complete len:134 (+) Transcript_52578:317-718(+)